MSNSVAKNANNKITPDSPTQLVLPVTRMFLAIARQRGDKIGWPLMCPLQLPNCLRTKSVSSAERMFPLAPQHGARVAEQSLRNTSTKECNHIELSTSKPQCRPPLLCISRFTASLVERIGAARERQRALCTWPAVGQAAEQRHEQAAGAPQLARFRAPVRSSDASMSPRLRALVARAAPALRP